MGCDGRCYLLVDGDRRTSIRSPMSMIIPCSRRTPPHRPSEVIAHACAGAGGGTVTVRLSFRPKPDREPDQRLLEEYTDRGHWFPIRHRPRPTVTHANGSHEATPAATHAKADGIRRVLTEPDGF